MPCSIGFIDAECDALAPLGDVSSQSQYKEMTFHLFSF